MKKAAQMTRYVKFCVAAKEYIYSQDRGAFEMTRQQLMSEDVEARGLTLAQVQETFTDPLIPRDAGGWQLSAASPLSFPPGTAGVAAAVTGIR